LLTVKGDRCRVVATPLPRGANRAPHCSTLRDRLMYPAKQTSKPRSSVPQRRRARQGEAGCSSTQCQIHFVQSVNFDKGFRALVLSLAEHAALRTAFLEFALITFVVGSTPPMAWGRPCTAPPAPTADLFQVPGSPVRIQIDVISNQQKRDLVLLLCTLCRTGQENSRSSHDSWLHRSSNIHESTVVAKLGACETPCFDHGRVELLAV
jgi:hypothetical protein